MMTAIIWRKSVYNSNRCPDCGALLIKNNEPYESVLVDMKERKLFCYKCGLYVGFIRDWDGEAEPNSKLGEWPENEPSGGF